MKQTITYEVENLDTAEDHAVQSQLLQVEEAENYDTGLSAYRGTPRILLSNKHDIFSHTIRGCSTHGTFIHELKTTSPGTERH